MDNTIITASLFGLKNSNRDFSKSESWGKNQFNSSFPTSLCCYLESQSLDVNYYTVKDKIFSVELRPVKNIFETSLITKDIFFAFETAYTPYQRYVKGRLPRIDLVIQDNTKGSCLRGLEIKLTALPDNTTCNMLDDKYGSEIVIRPDTIVYLACSIIESISDNLSNIIQSFAVDIHDWTDPKKVIPYIDIIHKCIFSISMQIQSNDIPFLMQPIWKTIGKSPELANNCLDVFVWSNSAFTYFIAENCNTDKNMIGISRHTRTCIWLYKMLFDYVQNSTFDCEQIIDELSYNTKNDKAFASSGIITNKYMGCENLVKPRITKDEIKNIILGGGQKLLSPERRFDAIIYNSPDLFLQT